MMHLTRRSALLGLASAFTLGRVSLALADAPTDRRFVVVILRGALDGLSAVIPYGDAALAGLRGEIVPPEPGHDEGMLDLGGFYGCIRRLPICMGCIGTARRWQCMPLPAPIGCAATSKRRTVWSAAPTIA